MRRNVATVAAVVLLGLFGWMAASVSPEHSTTADEIFHVTAGYSSWKFGDFRLQPENGNLPQRLAGLPLLWQDVHFPKLDQPAWKTADVAVIGHQFFHESGNDLPRMLAAARLMIAGLGVACGALVFFWSRALFGTTGALVSTTLFAFCPNLLAHAGLATSDMAATLGFLLAVGTGWQLLHRVTVGRILAFGAATALLALSKFSAPLLGPMLGLMALARAWRGAPLPVRLGGFTARRRGRAAAAWLVGSLKAAAVVAWALIWAAFDFRYAAVRGEGALNRTWANVTLTEPTAVIAPTASHQPASPTTLQPGAIQAVVGPLRSLHVLPEGWIYGLAHVDRYSRWRPAFFMGEYRTTGWVSFFPVAFLLKTTLPALALLGIAGLALLGRRPATARRGRLGYRLVPLLVLAVVYGGYALTIHLNIGHRHILPLYPVLYIGAGAVVLGFRQRAVALVTAILLTGHIAASVAIRPDYLAYFNPLLGGPAHAYQHLVDSSLDWGQDLPGLKRWLEAHAHGENIYLSYFGSGSPAAEGIQATRLADGNFDLGSRAVAPPMLGGVYCISATMFQQPYTLVRHGWTPDHERRYAELRTWSNAWHAGRDPLPREEAIPRLIELEHLRFGRLCAGLHERRPDAEVGYSILIFRLTDAEVHALLDGPPTYVP